MHAPLSSILIEEIDDDPCKRGNNCVVHFYAMPFSHNNATCFHHCKMLGYHCLRQTKTPPDIFDAFRLFNQSHRNFKSQWMTKYFKDRGRCLVDTHHYLTI